MKPSFLKVFRGRRGTLGQKKSIKNYTCLNKFLNVLRKIEICFACVEGNFIRKQVLTNM